VDDGREWGDDRAMPKVLDLMSQSVLTLSPDSTLDEAVQTLANLGVSGAPVVDNERLVGVFTKSDIVNDISDGEIDLSDLVRKTMSKSPLTVSPEEDIGVAVRLFAETKVHRIVVVDVCGAVVGILTPLDIVIALHEKRM
jgi:predicted transcriptional regulator